MMTFDYRGATTHLEPTELVALVKGLDECLPCRCYDGFYVGRDTVEVSGCWDDDYLDVTGDIEWILAKFDIDWKGGAEVTDAEPRWGGGYPKACDRRW